MAGRSMKARRNEGDSDAPYLCEAAQDHFDHAHALGLSARGRGISKMKEDHEFEQLCSDLNELLNGRSGISIKKVWGPLADEVCEYRVDSNGNRALVCQYHVVGRNIRHAQRAWNRGYRSEAKENPKPIIAYEDWYLAMAKAVHNKDSASARALQIAMDIGAVAPPRPERMQAVRVRNRR